MHLTYHDIISFPFLYALFIHLAFIPSFAFFFFFFFLPSACSPSCLPVALIPTYLPYLLPSLSACLS